MAENISELLAEIQDLTDKLETIAFGSVTDVIDHAGQTRPSLAKEINDKFTMLQAMVAGKIPFQTKAALIASGEPANNSDGVKPLAEVWNDPTLGNNGIYGWDGSAWVFSDYDIAIQLLSTVGAADGRGELVDRIQRFERSIVDDSQINDSDIVAAVADKNGRAAAAIFKDGDAGILGLRFFDSDKEEVYVNGRKIALGLGDDAGNIVVAIDVNGELHFNEVSLALDDETYASGLVAGVSDELGNVVLGFYPDGTVNLKLSSSAAASVMASLARNPSAVNSVGNAYCVTVIRAGLMRYLSDIAGGLSGYLQRVGSNTEMAETQGPIEFIAATGQSLSVGGGATENLEGEEVFTVNPINPNHCLMFNTGTRGAQSSVLNEAVLTDFVPAFEQFNGSNQAETQGSGMMRRLHADRISNGEKLKTYLYRSHGRGGSKISELIKGSGWAMYDNGLKELIRAREIAAEYGRDIVVRAVTWSQGEQERTSTSRGDYSAMLNQLLDDYKADWLAELPATNPPLMLIVDQLSAGDNTVAGDVSLSQYDVFKSRNDLVISTPKYFMEYSGSVHLKPKWYSILGEYQAKAYRALFETGVGFNPIYPTSVSITGRTISVVFNVPSPPLVFDTAMLPAADAMGFEFYDDSANTPSIESVILTGGDSVQITLTSDPVGLSKSLRYAYAGPGAVGRAGAWGNLRDSDNTTSETDSNIKLHNWCIIFDEVL